MWKHFYVQSFKCLLNQHRESMKLQETISQSNQIICHTIFLHEFIKSWPSKVDTILNIHEKLLDRLRLGDSNLRVSCQSSKKSIIFDQERKTPSESGGTFSSHKRGTPTCTWNCLIYHTLCNQRSTTSMAFFCAATGYHQDVNLLRHCRWFDHIYIYIIIKIYHDISISTRKGYIRALRHMCLLQVFMLKFQGCHLSQGTTGMAIWLPVELIKVAATCWLCGRELPEQLVSLGTLGTLRRFCCYWYKPFGQKQYLTKWAFLSDEARPSKLRWFAFCLTVCQAFLAPSKELVAQQK